MEKYTLVIVDLQYDFFDPNGSMYVKGAEELPDKIAKFINDHKEEISEVVFTLDWHPINHCSFAENGGQWPSHCVQYTIGAGLPSSLLKACEDNHLLYQFLFKGTCSGKDQYGAGDIIYVKNRFWDENEYVIGNIYNQSFQNIITASKRFAFCGLCGDYCVKETMKNFIDYGEFEAMAIPSLIKSIDNGKTFEEFVEQNSIKTIW